MICRRDRISMFSTVIMSVRSVSLHALHERQHRLELYHRNLGIHEDDPVLQGQTRVHTPR
jgi:hypothetical protein